MSASILASAAADRYHAARGSEDDLIRFGDRMTRGQTRAGWLDSRHSFSRSEHSDSAQVGFRALWFVNKDCVILGAGFPSHGHREMVTLAYLLSGVLEQKESIGNGTVVRPCELRPMSGGTEMGVDDIAAIEAESEISRDC